LRDFDLFFHCPYDFGLLVRFSFLYLCFSPIAFVLKTNAIHILHLDTNHPLLWAQLEAAGFTNEADCTSDKAAVEAKINQYHGIVIRSRFNIDAQFLEAATQLQFIARVGAGLESIDVEYATQKGVQLIAAPEGNRNAVGEQALGMLLSLMNKLNRADRMVRQGQWVREGNRGYELQGKTVGIIGYGNMGKSFAQKLSGFEVNVLCYDIQENVGDACARQVDLETLQAEADVVSLHIPWTPETHKMVNREFIQAFAKPFWLINTSRGKNVDTADLVEALQEGKVIGAGLDVLEYEKLSFESLFTDHRPEALQYLLDSENVLLTPHIAGWTYESHEKLAQTIVDKIKQKYGLFIPHDSAPNKEASVTGIGGIFFKSKDPKALKSWYATHLGIPVDDYGWSFWWKDAQGNDAMTQWAPFEASTRYFEPSDKEFMLNFRVHHLKQLLTELATQGVTIIGNPETYDYGTFAWILDPEGHKIELWEPIDAAFQEK
jgi:D-3-phosphoglycerate dehydrogenase